MDATPIRSETPVARRQIWGRRQAGRLTPARRLLLQDELPRRHLLLEPGAPLDPNGLFERPVEAVWLEIGFGGGEHLAAQAAANPQIGMIGVEPFINGVASLLAACRERRLDHVRVLVDDARLLVDALPEASIGRAFVLFPDPWPKARHKKRRIVNPATVAGLARVLGDGAELRLATDDPDYQQTMLALFLDQPAFVWEAGSPHDWRVRPADWPPTRYERKAIAAGRRPLYLRFMRRPRHSRST